MPRGRYQPSGWVSRRVIHANSLSYTVTHWNRLSREVVRVGKELRYFVSCRVCREVLWDAVVGVPQELVLGPILLVRREERSAQVCPPVLESVSCGVPVGRKEV